MQNASARARTLLIVFVLSLVVFPLLTAFGVTNFDSIVTTGDIIAGDDIAVLGNSALGNFVSANQRAAITVTSGGTVTPVGSYQQLTAAGAVGTSSITIQTAGTVVTFVNTAANTITFTDTGTLKLSGNAALGQFDSLTLLSDGTNWIRVGGSDN